MQFKDLEWKDIMSEGKFVCSTCKLNICGWIKITFTINHEPEQEKYYLYSFGDGNIRTLSPDKYDSVESAKAAAYRIYGEEMGRLKKTIDFLVEEGSESDG